MCYPICRDTKMKGGKEMKYCMEGDYDFRLDVLLCKKRTC